MRTGEPFREGEPCLLVEDRGRTFLLTLRLEGEFHFHRGMVPHADIVGRPEGTTVVSTRGAELVALRPRLADYVLKMSRGATILYPKDAAELLVWADVAPGCTVLEAGTGSGALTLVLARAVLPGGRVVSVERRPDHAAVAAERIAGLLGDVPDHVELRVGEVEEAVEEVRPDRIVLDVPEPWHTVVPAAEHLPGGGVLASYLPTVPQVQQLRSAMDDTAAFVEATTFEVLIRDWVVSGRSVRPSHRMIGHTGFLTVARKRLPPG